MCLPVIYAASTCPHIRIFACTPWSTYRCIPANGFSHSCPVRLFSMPQTRVFNYGDSSAVAISEGALGDGLGARIWLAAQVRCHLDTIESMHACARAARLAHLPQQGNTPGRLTAAWTRSIIHIT